MTPTGVPFRVAPAAALLVAAAALGVAPTVARADVVDALRDAVLPFRGIGHAQVQSYRVELTLPQDDEDPVPLLELWRAPAEYGLRAAGSAPAAVVRSWAIFLEPLYVARASLLDSDLERGAARLRAVAKAESRAQGDGRTLHLELPAEPDPELPDLLRDVTRLDAALDAQGRLTGFRLQLRGAPGRDGEILRLECTWADPRAPQPTQCTWTLPDGGTVNVTTTFRDESGRRVPGSRQVIFPSRYDPGETEEIRIDYGPYELNPPDLALDAKSTFRFDENGLIAD